jgi:hypothetical protein
MGTHRRAATVPVRFPVLLKREKTLKVGVKAKCMRAGWDTAYLLKILNAQALTKQVALEKFLVVLEHGKL